MEPEHISSNPERKEKKKKRKHGREGEEELPSDDKKQKKKRKKEEPSGPACNPTTDSPFEVVNISDSETVGTTITAFEVKERNKNKSFTGSSDNPPSFTTEPTPGSDAAGEPKKSRKRKSTNADADVDKEPSPKSTSRSKKQKQEEAIGEDEERQSTALPTEDHSSQKRKKSKASTHPNPGDDSDLTEQSQKGSHSFSTSLQPPKSPTTRSTVTALIYVCSQSASPETWKFNKARQNWVIRNVWTSEVSSGCIREVHSLTCFRSLQIPEKYVPMVVDYLSKVQGRVREVRGGLP